MHSACARLSFYKIAPYYYYPGWWEGGTANHFNLEKWNKLPKNCQAIFTGYDWPTRPRKLRWGPTPRKILLSIDGIRCFPAIGSTLVAGASNVGPAQKYRSGISPATAKAPGRAATSASALRRYCGARAQPARRSRA